MVRLGKMRMKCKSLGIYGICEDKMKLRAQMEDR